MIATATAADYDRIFEAERKMRYPAVDDFEYRMGYSINKDKLRNAARALACPLKKSPPNWQHGSVIYAATREYFARTKPDNAILLDIGTAKGFSALCLYWALWDSDTIGGVHSVDVIDPHSDERRNTVAEVDEPKDLFEVLEPWPEAQQITFYQSTGRKWLTDHAHRVHVAYVDGKHSYEAVSWEAALLAERQHPGDLAIFDDVQIDGVAKALKELHGYGLEYISVLPTRKYAIGRRK